MHQAMRASFIRVTGVRNHADSARRRRRNELRDPLHSPVRARRIERIGGMIDDGPADPGAMLRSIGGRRVADDFEWAHLPGGQSGSSHAMTCDTSPAGRGRSSIAGFPEWESRMRLRCFSFFTAVILLIAAAPIQSLAGSITSARQSADELLAADRGFAAAGTNADGISRLSSLFAADVIMPVGGKGFAKGRAAVTEALKANPGTSSARIEWAPVGVGVSADGNQGFSFGFMSEQQLDGKPTLLKYLAYWRRDESGWHVIAYKRGRRAAGAVDSTMRPASLPAPIISSAASRNGDAEHRQMLAQAEQAFSDAAQTLGLSAAFARFGSPDSMNLGGAGNSGFVFGAEAIAKLVGEGEPERGSSVSWAADERVIVADSGDLGLSVGYIRINGHTEDGSERPSIPFFTVWRRSGSDQAWRYLAE